MLIRLVYILTYLIGISAVFYLIRSYYPISVFISSELINVSLIIAAIALLVVNSIIMQRVLTIINILILWLLLYRIYSLKFINDSVLKNTATWTRYYHQRDMRWKNVKFGNGTLGSIGCGPAVAAMIVSSLADSEVTPTKAAEQAERYRFAATGTYMEFFYMFLRSYNIPYKVIRENDHASLRSSLEKKWWIISVIRPLPFLQKNHYVIIRDIRGDSILLANPDNYAGSRKYIKLDKFLKKCSPKYQFIAVKADRQGVSKSEYEIRKGLYEDSSNKN